MKYHEDNANSRIIITEITMKVEYTEDGRLSKPSENRYIKLSYTDFTNLMRLLGEGQYGPFYTQLELKYISLYLQVVHLLKSLYLCRIILNQGILPMLTSDLERRVVDLEDDLIFIKIQK